MKNSTLNTRLETEFDCLRQRSQHHAYHLAYRLTGNADDARDLMQDAYVRAWTHFSSYNRANSFEAWLNRIITNRAIDLHRRGRRVRMVSLDAPLYTGGDGPPVVYEIPAVGSNPEEIVIGAMMSERLHQALDALPDYYRRTLWLLEVEQRSCLEIADAMQCTYGTARSRIHRARRMLRNYLAVG